jgi:hypothetical protein
MVPYNVEVTVKDGEPQEYPISVGALIDWEEAHPNMTYREWSLKQTIKGLAYLAYFAAKHNGVVLKPFKDWYPTVSEVRLVPKDEA